MNHAPHTIPGEKVVVAMSGGVDSSAAAVLLKRAGYEVIGVAMQVWDYRQNGGNGKRASCCAPADFDDARSVAQNGNFPFYVFDFEEEFRAAVIEGFVNDYLAGLTPNPCLQCNRQIKFRQLRKRARSLGVDLIATGHYARVRRLADGTFGLFTARDTQKDQSYFLYTLTQEDLRRTLFPVGEMTKSEVRAYLASHQLSVSEKAESYDICFVSSSVGEFIESYRPDVKQDGAIVSRAGEVLGEHHGAYRYTVGQRHGLGISSSKPLYVLNVLPNENRVEVGTRDELKRDSFTVSDVRWISGAEPPGAIVLQVKLRYRHVGVRCRVEPLGSAPNLGARITFLDEWTPVSPGQAAVFYRPEAEPDGAVQVLGGGTIDRIQ